MNSALAPSETFSSRLTPLLGLGMLTLTQLPSTASDHMPVRSHRHSATLCEVGGNITHCSSEKEVADASTSVLSPTSKFQAVAAAAESLLKTHQIFPSRKAVTIDGSVLLEYLDGRNVSVDIYPNGDLVVMKQEGSHRKIHELKWTHLDRIPGLFADGGPVS
jgi:hypothetical protein